MQISKNSFVRKILLTITITSVAVVAGFAFYFTIFASSVDTGIGQVTSGAVAFYEKVQASAGMPVLLKIPKIKISANVESVGVTKSGSIGVPKGPVNAAWFNGSVRPGEMGVAIIDGHSGWRNAIPAVFDNLHKLKKGDKVSVQDKNGAIVNFVVTKISTYKESADSSDLFNLGDSKARLVLVTCAGDWNAIKKTHSDRLVVFTEKVTE